MPDVLMDKQKKSVRDRSDTLPGILMTENLMAFVRFVRRDGARARFFIIVFRFRAIIIIPPGGLLRGLCQGGVHIQGRRGLRIYGIQTLKHIPVDLLQPF